VSVEDLGKVTLRIGQQTVPGTDIRRKVLALLCYLVSRPDFAATRDAVVDALWPDLDPDAAVNSLNQTVYFLRRVFDPSFTEDLSPSYLHHDSDLVWLDRDLVSARSAICLDRMKSLSRNQTPHQAREISSIYQGKFALDFAYEEWAVGYREHLHVAYLHSIEEAVHSDMESGEYARAIELARLALQVDPEAEQLEVSLLRLYRMSGAHAAAAEQYAHYASVLRGEYGIEPPPLDTF
jgi:two-component SAPR family response regulator